MSKILYFPTISIPNSDWLLSSIFYWDKVGSIVPISFLEEPDRLTENMRRLVQLELVEQIVPEEHLININNFERNFIDFVDEFLRLGRQFGEYKGGSQKKEIHMGKLRGIGDLLVSRGLAEKNNGSWYQVDSEIASYFMIYLATVLGQHTDYIPMTDKYEEFVKLIPKKTADFHENIFKNKWRTKIIDQILPVPSHVESMEDIYKFKEKHYEELKAFRTRIESFILELEEHELIQPEDFLENKVIEFKEEMKDEIKKIEEHMRYFKWFKLDFSTFCAIGSTTLSFLSEPNLFSQSGATLSLLGAISSNIDKKSNENEAKSPLMYAALIKNKFGDVN